MNQQKIFSTLRNLGLTAGETQIYLEVLKMNPVRTSSIAHTLNTNRSTIRHTLENLLTKKFITKSNKNGTFYFSAKNPEELLSLIENKQNILNQQAFEVNEILNDLKKLQNPNSPLPKISFFEGTDGLIKVYKDILIDLQDNPQINLYGFLSHNKKKFSKKFLDFGEKVYTPARKKLKNKSFMIFCDNEDTTKYAQKEDKLANRISLFVPRNEFPIKNSFHIYGNKIALCTHLNTSTATGVIIENSSITDDHLLHFKMAWKYAQTLDANKGHLNVNLPI